MKRTILLALLLASNGLAGPRVISHEGRLLRSDGTAERATLQLSFAIYAAPSGGPALWTEPHFVAPSADGYYAVHLGGAAALPSFDGADFWLGVTVAGETEMSPRARLASVPFALKAGGARLDSIAVRPGCDASRRGDFWMTAGGTGVADKLEVCAKDGSDLYGWRPSIRGCSLSQGGLAAYLPLDGSFVDASGNGLDGIGVNGPVFVAGKVGQAISLNGTNQYVDLQSSGGQHMFYTGLTLAAWIKFPSAGLTSQRVLIGKHQAGVSAGYFLDISPPGVPGMYTSGVGGTSSSFQIGDNTWHHVAGTWNGATQIVYVDGVVRARTFGGAINNVGVTIKLGTLDGGPYHFPGQLDEATIWNRALSQTEIQELMTCGPLR